MVLMVTAPIIIRVAERAGVPIGAHLWAFISFSWMGVLFLFISGLFVFDLCSFISGSYFFIKKEKRKNYFSHKSTVILSALVAVGIFIYGLFEASTLRVEHLLIKSDKISEQAERFRIAQISDVHLGLLVRQRKLEKILSAVQKTEPDILVSTGDLLDGQINNLTDEAELFRRYQPSLGKYAILGNHEFYAGLQDSLQFLKKSGFTILRQKSQQVKNISIVGIDDQAAGYVGGSIPFSLQKLLAAQPTDTFTLLLKHRPDLIPENDGFFDLQLSGHTHKGQIFPFNMVVWLFYPYHAGRLTKLAKGSIYTSRGTGTWGPPIRFLAPPEITIIDIVHGES
jgi:predicted MPP superfamily phosphohydrolase